MPRLLRNINKRFNRHSQGLLVIVVLFIGVSAVVLGGFNIRKSLYAPYAPPSGLDSLAYAGLNNNGSELLDTDGDGLFDQDELGFYGTSPYLLDSDSDGLTDGDEIAAGTDPNCPEGQKCFTENVEPSKEGEVVLPGADLLGNSDDNIPSVAELRGLLLNAGFSEAELNKLSDDEVLKSYKDALARRQASQLGNDTPLATVKNLSSEQIRELLREAGIGDEVLNKVSDDNLLKIYTEVLNELEQK